MSIWEMLNSILRFFEHESCGKCVPCRVGSTHLLLLMKQIKNSTGGTGILKDKLVQQAELMERTSLCPSGNRISCP
jgi:NADH-quinone oxidoreductase subunit F